MAVGDRAGLRGEFRLFRDGGAHWDNFTFMNADVGGEGGQTRYAADGPWGGDGIQLTVGKEHSTIEYPCADGEIPGRFRLARNGTFKLSGSHVRLRPGPVRPDRKELREPALFEGKVTGERMTLKVTLLNSSEEVGEFRLRKGVLERIRRCL